MFVFFAILEFFLSLTLLALALALNLNFPWVQPWATALVLLLVAGAWSLFVCLASFCCRTPPLAVILRVIAVILDLVAFIVALTNFPFSSGCSSNGSTGCQVLKAAIGIDGALWILFIVSMCTLGNSREREVEVRVEREREVRRGPYYYY